MALSPSANVKAVSSYKGIFTNIREFIKIFQTFRPCKAAWAILEQFHRQVGAAQKAYRQFLQEGLGTGHQAHYYEAVDQRFLGDERFLAEIQQKTETKHEVMVKGPKIRFARVLQAVATVTGHSPDHLVRTGRQRNRGAARALLVYAARDWSGLSVKDLGRRLHRDPSMVSRLYAHYVAARRHSWEKRVLGLLKK
jgi:hypothetical protein